jgi:16S rRNA (guanine(966)-N(2))-methyltransferase RsmD
MVREALFSLLGRDLLQGPFLDLYAGTGVVAFEALSRGASRVVVVESHKTALDCIRKSAAELGCEDKIEIISGDAWKFKRPPVFQTVFADPPFGAIPEGLRERCLELCRPGGRAILQWPSDRPREWDAGIDVRRYGASQLILSRKGDVSATAPVGAGE